MLIPTSKSWPWWPPTTGSTVQPRRLWFQVSSSVTIRQKTNVLADQKGSPPIWTPKPPGTRLNPDTGLVYIDQNAYLNPDSPLEPLFRAVYAMHTGFDATGIDIVTDRNNLRKLLQFVVGASNDFRIEIENINGITLFTRFEENTSEFIQTGDFRGFGHQFEDNYTTWPMGTEGSIGHHRIIRYKFAGLSCLVRFQVDTCIPDGYAASLASNLSEPVARRGFNEEENVSKINTINGGSLVAQSSIAEIKTRAASRQLDMSDVLPQLWFSDTQQLIVGYHKGGRFDDRDVKELDMIRTLEDWERTNAKSLAKLGELLKIIVAAAKKAEDGRFSVVCRGKKLDIEKVAPGNPQYKLPMDLRRKLEATSTSVPE
jgi:hypothetical protein